MERIRLMILKKWYIVLYWYYKICKYAKSDKYSEKEKYEFLHNIMKKIIKAGNIDTIIEGTENLPKDNGYILFPNHQGLFDALIIIQANEAPVTFVMKKEVEKNWFLRKIVKVINAQLIDRNDIRQSLTVINNVTKQVKEGRNYVIFAEGTRSKKGNELLEFKGGSFKSAFNARCPIVPVALIDSYKAFDNKSTDKVTVRMSYLKPIYYEEYKNMKTSEIAKVVRDRIKEYIDDNINSQCI
jgi:1-acyl-sn-glycerol-3-phosphate acyltransferase